MRRSILSIAALTLLFSVNLFGQDIELCDNGIDDDGDGLIDCLDDDLANDCCCLDAWTLDLGDDLLICEGDEVVLDAGAGFSSYEWQDRSTDQTLVANQAGEYFVTAVDTCGNEVGDTLFISYIPIIQAFEEYTFCQGDTIEINGLKYTQEGMFTQTFTSSLTGCDSILVLDFSLYDLQSSEEYHSFCEGEGININGEDYFEAGQFSQFYEDSNGCEAELILNLSYNPSCITCGEDSPFGRMAIKIQKVAVDLNKVIITKGEHQLFSESVSDHFLEDVIHSFIGFKYGPKASISEMVELLPVKNASQNIELSTSEKAEVSYIKSSLKSLRVGYSISFN